MGKGEIMEDFVDYDKTILLLKKDAISGTSTMYLHECKPRNNLNNQNSGS